jgi:hypothetical protein
VKISFLPLSDLYSLGTAGVEDEHLTSDASGLGQQVPSFLRKEQSIEVGSEESVDRSVCERQMQRVGPDHWHLRNPCL